MGTPPQGPPSHKAADFIPVADGCQRRRKSAVSHRGAALRAKPLLQHAKSNENGMYPRLTQRWSAARDFSASVRCDWRMMGLVSQAPVNAWRPAREEAITCYDLIVPFLPPPVPTRSVWRCCIHCLFVFTCSVICPQLRCKLAANPPSELSDAVVVQMSYVLKWHQLQLNPFIVSRRNKARRRHHRN